METLVIERADGTRLWRAEIARSWLARARGLIGRKGLGAGEGLFFPGTNSIHMLCMRFAIDCVFVGAADLDGARPVVAVRADLRPWTSVVWWVRGARGALELGAGSVEAAGVRVGDELRFVPDTA